MVVKSTVSTRAKEKISPSPKSLVVSSGGLASTNLALVKKESQRIAKNPKRFLESFAEGKTTPIVSSLTTLLAHVDRDLESGGSTSTMTGAGRLDSELVEKAQEFQNKYKLSKTRTLLLNMSMPSAGTGVNSLGGLFKNMPEISSDPPNQAKHQGPSRGSSGHPSIRTGSQSRYPPKPRPLSSSLERSELSSRKPSYSTTGERPMEKERQAHNQLQHVNFSENLAESQQKGSYYDKTLDKNDADQVEKAVEGFIDRIKNTDIDNVIIWINTLATMKDIHLPFGFPSNLVIPLNPETVKEPELRAFAESAADDFLLLDGEYSAKLEEIGKRLRENWESLQSSRWTPKDSALLFYIITALEDSSAPSVAGLRAELLAKLFPTFGEEQVALQKYRLRMKRAWEEKRGAILKDWVRDRDDITTKINEGWTTLQGTLTKKGELAKEHHDQLDRCKYWREQLDKLRKEKRARIRRIQVIVEPFEKVLEERARSRLEEEERHRRNQRLLLSQFKKEQARQLDQERRDKQHLEAELEKNAKLQALHNQSRVAVRHFALEQKKEAAKELERLKEQEMQIRKAILEKTKAKVEIDYHPSNLLADTHSSLLHRKEIPGDDLSPEEEEMVTFFRIRYAHSFSSERVLADRRLRVETKLRDAGLIDNAYARQVLLAMEPKPKPHLVSNIDLKQE